MSEAGTQIMDWEEALARVDAFVASHPEIEVSTSGLGIPRKVREAFYSVLLNARRMLAISVISDTDFAEKSIDALKDTRQRLMARLGIEALILPVALQAFIDDVYGGSSQVLIDAMLSYVQGRLDVSDLHYQAAQTVPQAFFQLTMAAYEASVAYSCIEILEPVSVYTAEPISDFSAGLVPAEVLEMGYQMFSPTMRLPEAVFETASGLIAFKFELVSEIDFYNSRPKRRRDFSSGGDSHGVIGRRFALFYRMKKSKTIPVLAERDKGIMLNPHVVIGTLGAKDLEIESYCQMTLKRMETLAAQNVAVIIAFDGFKGVEELAGRPGAPAFDIVETEPDVSKLKQYIDMLT
ncbi:MAG: hypothetical protein LBK67_12075 [Coriobacteriales bacterium]|jgi:hypothetical protein|nr:hypothetical protein [Coriobacteriales bacterium]